VPRHGIGRQVQRTSSGSTPHDRVAIPQICSSRSLPLRRPRQSTLRQPAVDANQSPTHSVRRNPPHIYEPLPLRPTCFIGSIPIPHLIRCVQIPIVNAAPATSPSRGFLPGRFADAGPVCAAPPSWGPASANLHLNGRRLVTGIHDRIGLPSSCPGYPRSQLSGQTCPLGSFVPHPDIRRAAQSRANQMVYKLAQANPLL
jgi:hypothetical protein